LGWSSTKKGSKPSGNGEDDPEEEVGEGSGCSDDVGELGVMAIDNPSCGDEVEGDDSRESVPLDPNDGDGV